MQTDYVIVGGGIAGASIAYHLSLATDADITLFERQSLGSETTYKSVSQFGYYGDATQYRMKRYGMKLYNEFFSDPQANPRYHSMGLLLTAETTDNAAQLERYVEGVERSSSKLGMGSDRDLMEYIDGEELHELLLLPGLKTDIIEGALFRPKVGYMDRPQELVHEFIHRAEDQGVKVITGRSVAEILLEGDRVTGVRTDSGKEVRAGEVICAAGPWNIELAASVGLDIPVKHTIAPLLLLEPEHPMDYDIPVINPAESPYTFHRRRENELLLGYNPGYDSATEYDPNLLSDKVSEEIITEGINELSRYLPGWIDAEIVEQWVGIRSQTPDGNPIVGWTDIEGFSLAAFHTSGIQLAPAVGDIITRQLVHDEPTEYYDALSISRFDGFSDHHGN